MKFIDISKDVMTCEVFPGDPTPTLEQVKTIGYDVEYNLSKIDMCLHNGTHMDAPLHFFFYSTTFFCGLQVEIDL